MKQTGIKFSSFCVALALLLCSFVTVYAEDSSAADSSGADASGADSSAGDNPDIDDSKKLEINSDAEVSVGQTVTYDLYLSDADEEIMGFELRLFYDSDFLEYQQKSLNFEKFDFVIYNENIEGKIPMNFSSLSSLPSFKEKAQFLSASFKVKKEGNADITYFFTELYGENLEYLKKYKFTYDMTVDGEKIVDDAVPPVNEDENTLQNNQGDFINYEDGMGDENTPNKSDHKMVGSIVNKSVVEVTRSVLSTEDEKGGFSSKWLFLLIGAPLIIGAVVAAIVIVNKRGKNES